MSFCQAVQGVQYKAAFAVTVPIKGISRTKFYEKLGLESIILRRLHTLLCTLCKIKIKKQPCYLSKYILTGKKQYSNWIHDECVCQCRTDDLEKPPSRMEQTWYQYLQIPKTAISIQELSTQNRF